MGQRMIGSMSMSLFVYFQNRFKELSLFISIGMEKIITIQLVIILEDIKGITLKEYLVMFMIGLLMVLFHCTKLGMVGIIIIIQIIVQLMGKVNGNVNISNVMFPTK